MIRTAVFVVLLCGAIIWLPVWLQLVGFVVGTIFTPYRLTLFIPAILADTLYAPTMSGVFFLQYTLIVTLLLIVHWVISTKTRIGEVYAVEKK